MAFWRIFELKISKIFVIFGNSTLKFIEMSNIKQKKKKIKFGTKNAFFGYFVLKFDKVSSYLESVPSNLLKCKVLCQNKDS